MITGSSATIKNNIFHSLPMGAVSADSGSVTEDYNVYYNSQVSKSIGSHSVIADPKFVSATPTKPADFRLQSNSPAINSGAILGAPYNVAIDPLGTAIPFATVDQNTLGSSWERGAFAFRPSGTPTNTLPTTDSLTPNTGSGSSQTFTVKYSYWSGYGALTSLNLLFNSSLARAGSCWIRYYAPANVFYLQDNTGDTPLGPLVPGSAGKIQNSQCVVNGTGTSAVGSGTTLTVTVSVSFNPSFVGSKQVYAYASSTGGSSSWQKLGGWTVP